MSDNFFRTPEEELARLNRELAEIREVLRGATERLSQIERHVKRAFGVKNSPKAARKPKKAGPETPSMSPEESLERFRELTDLSRSKGSTAVEECLERMSVADLKLMAYELGVSFRSKPSRRDLHTGIRGRISESVMLSRNQNVTTPLSEQKEGPSGQQISEPQDNKVADGEENQ